MKIAIFGASGTAGKHLVRKSLDAGHSVRAFGRSVNKLSPHANLELIQGDIFNPSDVSKAIQGCDAVLSALGGGTEADDRTRSNGIKMICDQMKKNNVRRIIAIGNSGVLNKNEEQLNMEAPEFDQRFLSVANEHLRSFRELEKSGLDFTFMCAPSLKDEEASGQYIVRADYAPVPNAAKIKLGDLAAFMVKEAQENKFVGKRVGISN